ncbi:hypothetical protein JCM11251_006911 [Rhodosporidiobolus azoricus]
MFGDPSSFTQQLEPVTSKSLQGHLGHLDATQEKALMDFKRLLEEKGYYAPASGGRDASHDDVDLVRFLRARRFEPAGAFAQFSSAQDWRKSAKVDELYDTFSLEEYDMARALYPQWTGRRDKAGLPVYLFKVGALTKDKTDKYIKATNERLDERMVALYENMVQFVVPICSSTPHEHNETPVSGCATMVDISGVSLKRFWDLKSHMQRASTLASAHYPETLGAIYLIGAPNFFSVVWGWVKKWFDPGTVEKIHILPSDRTAALSILTAHIPPSSIPCSYGGELDWDFGSPAPNLDAELQKSLGREECPAGPMRWDSKKGMAKVVGEGRSQWVEKQGTGQAAEDAASAPAPGQGGESAAAPTSAADEKDVFVTPPSSPSAIEPTEASLAQRLEETKLQ